MSGQVLELLIFGGIAFFIISKLISILGNTSDDDPSRRKSFFGENSILKDVTPKTDTSATILKPKFLNASKAKSTTNLKASLKEFVVLENQDSIAEGLAELLEKIPSFDVSRFINNAKTAFKMIIEATLQNNEAELAELVDKRYLDNFKKRVMPNYAYLTEDLGKLSARVSEIYIFGNNLFVKILFTDTNSEKLWPAEEWTFSKSALNNSPAWYLTNIDSENIARA